MEKESVKYSVIIPVYNAEMTLGRCLDSILFQIRDDIEIIIVNDGSTDETDHICDLYRSKVENVIYLKKDNEGVAIARNTGIQHSGGRYILFVDSDDYVCPDLFSTLDTILDEFDYDYIALSYQSLQDGKLTVHTKSNFAAKDRQDALKKASDMIASKEINSPWAKLYKASIIKKHTVDFTPHVSISEDRTFNVKYCMYINSMCTSSFVGYVVTLDNAASLSRGKKENLNHQYSLTSADYEREFKRCRLSEKEKQILRMGLNFCEYRSVYSDAKRMHREGFSLKERRRYIKKQCRELNRMHLKVSFSKYNLMIVLPVRFRLYSLIDLIAYKLAGSH